MTTIKRMTKDHLPACTELYISVFNGAPWNDQWTVETASRRLEDIFYSPNFEGIVSIQDDEIQGAIFGNYEQFYEGLHYNLREMYVACGHQGTGIGTAMLRELEKKLNSLGVTEVILFTSKGNKTSEFYLKSGYAEWTSMAMMGKEIKSYIC